jgi:hypothetical protein
MQSFPSPFFVFLPHNYTHCPRLLSFFFHQLTAAWIKANAH